MGNTSPRATAAPHSVDGVYVQTRGSLHQITSINSAGSCSGPSFVSVSSHQSTHSLSRPWSRTSRRRWKESTLTLPLELSKTAWPVSQLESLFLPDFPISPQVSERNFDVLEEIACGAFGKVYRVRELESQKVFALKVLLKSKIVKEDAVLQVKNEVQIQRACGHHTFIVNCPYRWQSKKRLYIVSDYVGGGELFNLLKAYFILPIVLVQLYVAEIALAIDFLHNAGIVHRDLKPENILLDDSGHIQLIDFGLAKWLSYGSKATRVCGTLRYMAPEIVGLQPYGHAVDWWSLGVIACVMLTGQYPAAAVAAENDPEEARKAPGALPDGCFLDVPCRDLLGRLLEVDPTRRLRSLRTLQTIAFYKGYNFEDVKHKKIDPNQLLQEYFPDGPLTRNDLQPQVDVVS